MATSIINKFATAPLATAATSTTTTATTQPAMVTEDTLSDVFEGPTNVLSQQPTQGSSLLSQGAQAGEPFTAASASGLEQFAELLVEYITQSAGSSNALGVGVSTNATTSTSTTTTETTTPGDNSNTSATFDTSLLPARSAADAQFTQAGIDAINNLPASTVGNLNINDYVYAAQNAMENGGYSQTQIGNFMTGLDQGFAQRNAATSTNSGTAGTAAASGSSATASATIPDGNNSNTSTTFAASLLPATSVTDSEFTQAGANAINNMPASTLSNLNINDYVYAAQNAMENSGYSQTQIGNFMTGLDEAFAQRTAPASANSSAASANSSASGAGGTGQTYDPAEQQQSSQLETTS